MNMYRFSSKADALLFLSSRLQKSVVDEFVSFTAAEWHEDSAVLLKKIQRGFGGAHVIARSSAVDEDIPPLSRAGHFASIADVPADSLDALATAINDVIASYSKDRRQALPDDQIIIQRFVVNVRRSGVVLTRDLPSYPDYYLINFDDVSGRTDTVTGGLDSQAVRLARWLPPLEIGSDWGSLLEAVQEVEAVSGSEALAIEFVVDREGTVHVFQARPITPAGSNAHANIVSLEVAVRSLQETLDEAFKSSDSLPGARTILADMPDWNPAEILGGRCDRLDHDLYAFLITDGSWNKGRVSLGYTDVAPSRLMLRLGDKSYIDARVSFNSLTPAGLPTEVRRDLIDYYLDRLGAQPELQDKVEFEIVATCLNLASAERLNDMRRSGISAGAVSSLEDALRHVTSGVLADARKCMTEDGAAVERLDGIRKSCLQRVQESPNDVVGVVGAFRTLLAACRDLGGRPFARTARIAFVGVDLLKSFVRAGVFSESHLEDFLRCIDTVTSRLRRDHRSVVSGMLPIGLFMAEYGHLRPGTYSITAPRLDQRPDLISKNVHQTPAEPAVAAGQVLPLARIDAALRRLNLDLTPKALLDIVATSLRERERIKFEFSRSLSDAIEFAALGGAAAGFSREDMANLDLSTLIATGEPDGAIRELWEPVIRHNRHLREECSRVAFPPMLAGARDLAEVRYPRARPQFITRRRVSGECVRLDGIRHKEGVDVDGKILLCQRADPGYDWIFTHAIRGLVTQYGGVASHMAVRCAEFGVPAAIGCGDVLYSRLDGAAQVTLDCENEKIFGLY